MIIDRVKAIYYDDIVKIVKSTPNDKKLGQKIRQYIDILERPKRRYIICKPRRTR